MQDYLVLVVCPGHIPFMPAAIKEQVTWQDAKKSGTALYKWRRSIGVNRESFARFANLSERTLATYEKHRTFPAGIRPQVNEAVRLLGALREIIPPGELTTWLQKPNPGFGGRRPWTLIKNGERDIIWAMIHQTRQSAFA